MVKTAHLTITLRETEVADVQLWYKLEPTSKMVDALVRRELP
jgi:hypothetical protein